MNVVVTLCGREFAVELEGDRAVVRSGDATIAVQLLAPPASTVLSAGAEVLVTPTGRHGAAGPSPLHVSFWGQAAPPRPAWTLRLVADGMPLEAVVETERDRLRGRLTAAPRRSGSHRISSPLPGVIRRVFVFPGNEVVEGTPIMTLEAMKMENEIRAESSGTLAALHVDEGQVVNAGDKLCDIRTSEDSSST